MPHTAAVIQSRTTSSRLPGKALRQIEGHSLTEHIIKRAQSVGVFDAIVLAIPDLPSEEPLADIAEKQGILCVRGPEDDVLERFIQAGEAAGAGHLLRICGDNPLIDIELMARLHQAHLKHQSDYTVSSDPVPLGTGTEMVRLEALRQIRAATRETRYREHVTTWFQDHPENFNRVTVRAPWYLRNIQVRLTVDTEPDFELVALLYGRFFAESGPVVDLEQVIHFLGQHPEIAAHNADVPQKDWRA